MQGLKSLKATHLQVMTLVCKPRGSCMLTLMQHDSQAPHVLPHNFRGPEVNGNQVVRQIRPLLGNTLRGPDVPLAYLHKTPAHADSRQGGCHHACSGQAPLCVCKNRVLVHTLLVAHRMRLCGHPVACASLWRRRYASEDAEEIA